MKEMQMWKKLINEQRVQPKEGEKKFLEQSVTLTTTYVKLYITTVTW